MMLIISQDHWNLVVIPVKKDTRWLSYQWEWKYIVGDSKPLGNFCSDYHTTKGLDWLQVLWISNYKTSDRNSPESIFANDRPLCLGHFTSVISHRVSFLV